MSDSKEGDQESLSDWSMVDHEEDNITMQATDGDEERTPAEGNNEEVESEEDEMAALGQKIEEVKGLRLSGAESSDIETLDYAGLEGYAEAVPDQALGNCNLGLSDSFTEYVRVSRPSFSYSADVDSESISSEELPEERIRRRRSEKPEATQDEDTDLSLASSPSLPDNLPAIKPDLQYIHTPHDDLNMRLNIVVALTIACVLGLGLGHFLGIVRFFSVNDGKGWSSRTLWEENLNAAQVRKLRELQDNLLSCMSSTPSYVASNPSPNFLDDLRCLSYEDLPLGLRQSISEPELNQKTSEESYARDVLAEHLENTLGGKDVSQAKDDSQFDSIIPKYIEDPKSRYDVPNSRLRKADGKMSETFMGAAVRVEESDSMESGGDWNHLSETGRSDESSARGSYDANDAVSPPIEETVNPRHRVDGNLVARQKSKHASAVLDNDRFEYFNVSTLRLSAKINMKTGNVVISLPLYNSAFYEKLNAENRPLKPYVKLPLQSKFAPESDVEDSLPETHDEDSCELSQSSEVAESGRLVDAPTGPGGGRRSTEDLTQNGPPLLAPRPSKPLTNRRVLDLTESDAEILESIRNENSVLESTLSELQSKSTDGDSKFSGIEANALRESREKVNRVILDNEDMRLALSRHRFADLEGADKVAFNDVSQENYRLRTAVAQREHLANDPMQLEEHFRALKEENSELLKKVGQIRHEQPIPKELTPMVRQLEDLKRQVDDEAKRSGMTSALQNAKSYVAYMSQVMSAFSSLRDFEEKSLSEKIDAANDVFNYLIPKGVKLPTKVQEEVSKSRKQLVAMKNSISNKWKQLKELTRPERIVGAGQTTVAKMNRVIVNAVTKMKQLGQATIMTSKSQGKLEDSVSDFAKDLASLNRQLDDTWHSLEPHQRVDSGAEMVPKTEDVAPPSTEDDEIPEIEIEEILSELDDEASPSDSAERPLQGAKENSPKSKGNPKDDPKTKKKDLKNEKKSQEKDKLEHSKGSDRNGKDKQESEHKYYKGQYNKYDKAKKDSTEDNSKSQSESLRRDKGLRKLWDSSPSKHARDPSPKSQFIRRRGKEIKETKESFELILVPNDDGGQCEDEANMSLNVIPHFDLGVGSDEKVGSLILVNGAGTKGVRESVNDVKKSVNDTRKGRNEWRMDGKECARDTHRNHTKDSARQNGVLKITLKNTEQRKYKLQKSGNEMIISNYNDIKDTNIKTDHKRKNIYEERDENSKKYDHNKSEYKKKKKRSHKTGIEESGADHLDSKRSASQFKRNAPNEVTNKRNAPKEVTNKRNAPKEVTAKRNAPNEVTNKRNAPNEVTNKRNAPKEVTKPKSEFAPEEFRSDRLNGEKRQPVSKLERKPELRSDGAESGKGGSNRSKKNYKHRKEYEPKVESNYDRGEKIEKYVKRDKRFKGTKDDDGVHRKKDRNEEVTDVESERRHQLKIKPRFAKKRTEENGRKKSQIETNDAKEYNSYKKNKRGLHVEPEEKLDRRHEEVKSDSNRIRKEKDHWKSKHSEARNPKSAREFKQNEKEIKEGRSKRDRSEERGERRREKCSHGRTQRERDGDDDDHYEPKENAAPKQSSKWENKERRKTNTKEYISKGKIKNENWKVNEFDVRGV